MRQFLTCVRETKAGCEGMQPAEDAQFLSLTTWILTSTVFFTASSTTSNVKVAHWGELLLCPLIYELPTVSVFCFLQLVCMICVLSCAHFVPHLYVITCHFMGFHASRQKTEAEVIQQGRRWHSVHSCVVLKKWNDELCENRPKNSFTSLGRYLEAYNFTTS